MEGRNLAPCYILYAPIFKALGFSAVPDFLHLGICPNPWPVLGSKHAEHVDLHSSSNSKVGLLVLQYEVQVAPSVGSATHVGQLA